MGAVTHMCVVAGFGIRSRGTSTFAASNTARASTRAQVLPYTPLMLGNLTRGYCGLVMKASIASSNTSQCPTTI